MKSLLRYGKKEKDERGFTLVELMIAIVLSTIIMLGGGEMLRQLIVVSAQKTDETVAIVQVQNAGFWIGQDAIQAQTLACFDPVTDPQKRLLSLSWTDWDGTPHNVIYSVIDRSDELGGDLWDFMRYDSATDETILISEFLDPSATNCSWNAADSVLEFVVTAKVDNQTETRTNSIRPRAVE